MTEFEVIVEANTKPARTKRKPPMDATESLFLDKVREVKQNLLAGHDTLVVLAYHRSFDKIFNHYTPAMKLYARHAKLLVKTLDEMTAEDLECKIVEMDKE